MTLYINEDTGQRAMTPQEEIEFLAGLPSSSQLLELERNSMECSPFQGRVVLGPDEVARFEGILADDTNFTELGMTALQIWILREAVKETIVWRRNSQAMATFAFLMGYTDAQMDTLFRDAALVDV